MSCEKPQKGNLHELTINQHCFPKKSIERFVGGDGSVSVYLLQQQKTVRIKPNNDLFCAKRVWDQRAESGYMRHIEDKYQCIAEQIVSGGGTLESILDDLNHHAREALLWENAFFGEKRNND